MAALKTNDAYDHLFDYYGQVYNVDPALIKTAFHVETMGNPNSKDSPAGAQGGMQIMPQLAKHYGIDPHDMTQAIPAATAYLAEGLQATGGDPAGALAYYNGGPKSLQRWKPETQGYVAKAQEYYPQIKITNLAGPLPAGETKPAPMVMADASGPDLGKFRQEWGIDAPAGGQAPDIQKFREEWGIPANSNAPAPTPAQSKPTLVSDSAASRPPPPAPPVMGDPNAAANALGGDQFIPNPLASNPSQGAYSALRNALEPAPNTTYGNVLPFATDNATGETRWGTLPPTLRALAQGAVDLAYGPGMGKITPEATGALGALATPLMRSPANIPGRFTLFPSSKSAGATPNPLASPVAAPPIAEPAPSFGMPAGRNFEVDAMGNVTQSGLPVPVGGAPVPEPAANPLIAGAPVSASPGSPLAAAASRNVEPQGPIVQPRADKAISLSPTEQAGYDAIRAPREPLPPGAIPLPPGAPRGTPPLGEPGYTHTTPGVDPSTLSPTEAAGYAAIHDVPPPAPMIPPMTKAGAQKIADNLIHYFHSGNEPLAPADVVVPPGYHPTLTGLTNDPGLATLHRGLEGVSAAPAVVAQRNAQAINSAAHALQGEPGDIATMEATRDALTGPMREAAFTNKTDATAQPAIDAANKILAGPDSKRPGVVKYVAQIRDLLHTGTGNNAPETDPEMLYGVHKQINDLLSPLAQSQDADKQAASASLMKLKPLVQNAIESGAPGFKDYMKLHAELSQPIDAQRYLQSLNLTSATGDVRLQAVDSAIKNIQKQQQLPGVPKAKWVTDDQMNQLVALRNALRMEAARGTGKPINSTTFQNLATNSKVAQIVGNPLASIGGGLAGLATLGPQGVLLGVGNEAAKQVLSRSEAMVKEAVLERLLNFSGKGEATLKAKPPPAAPGAPWNPLYTGPAPPPGNTTHGAPWNMRP